jgi:hypothetical protein
MDEPLERLAQQRQLQREHAADERQAQLYDPSSRPSRMAQAIAIKRYGWSPEDASQLTAADMPMVDKGFSAEETFKARKEKAAAQRKDAQDKLAAEERMNQARIDERRWETGERAKDRAAMAGNKPISDRVELQTQGTQEMLEAADEMDRVADQIGVGNAVLHAGAANRDYNNAVAKAAQAEAKAVHGGPSGNAAQEFGRNYLGALDPRASADQVRAQAQKLRERARLRGEAINEAFQGQGKRGPIPPEVLQRGRGSTAGSAQETRIIGGRRYVKVNGQWNEQVG